MNARVAVAVALLIPTVAFSAAEDWYSPKSGFPAGLGKATLYYDEDVNGNPLKKDIAIGADGVPIGNIDNAEWSPQLRTAYEALIKACLNEVRIGAIGQNLEAIFSAKGMWVEQIGPDGQKHRVRYSLKIKKPDGTESDVEFEVEDPKPYNLLPDNNTIAWDVNRLTLKGWGNPSAYNNAGLTPLGTALTSPNKTGSSSYKLLARKNGSVNEGLRYVDIGDVSGGGSPIDGVSITTNATAGAVLQGYASLFGFSTASAYDIPCKLAEDSDATLRWLHPGFWVDGVSLAWHDPEDEDAPHWQIKGADEVAGVLNNRYFGTSSDDEATLGWHELPNVSTNSIGGDDVTTVSDPAVPNSSFPDGFKPIGLKGWNYSYASDEPLYLVNVGGTLKYEPFAFPTNNLPGSPVDDITITTNATAGAIEQGVASLAGWADAPANSVPMKDSEGRLVWGEVLDVTNRILAGAGINITDNGGGAITISAQALGGGSVGGGSVGGGSVVEMTVVTDVRYDAETHKFQIKTRQVSFNGSVGDDSGWQDVFEAVSHASEHNAGDLQ